MNFFRFAAGSIGLFTICMVFALPYLEGILGRMVSGTLGLIGNHTGYFSVFNENSIVSIDTKSGIVSMMINYECSGVIEMLAFTCLAMFFPFGGIRKKYLYAALGNVYIFAANIVRVLSIIVITKTAGAGAFYAAHTIIARILFFALMILLYYFVFTKLHLRYQNVGEIR